ncbi:Glucose-6-phosphate 1-epimerase, partial [Fusarium culmorum]
MVDRPNKPSALASTPAAPPQAVADITHDNSRVKAVLPSGESVEVLLHGATVISWKDASGAEKLWVSETAALDGSAPVRGGLWYRPDHEPVAKLPQHGFARNSRWEFLGKSTSEGSSSSVKLDFGLSSESISDDFKALWPYKFALIYSVSLDSESLNTSIVITNDGDAAFDFQTLLHTYFKISDIASTEVTGLEDSVYLSKVSGSEATQSGAITFSGETDSVYTPANGPKHPVVISESGSPRYRIVRDNLDQVVVWNPWVDKSAGIKDFSPRTAGRTCCALSPVPSRAGRSWKRAMPLRRRKPSHWLD